MSTCSNADSMPRKGVVVDRSHSQSYSDDDDADEYDADLMLLASPTRPGSSNSNSAVNMFKSPARSMFKTVSEHALTYQLQDLAVTSTPGRSSQQNSVTCSTTTTPARLISPATLDAMRCTPTRSSSQGGSQVESVFSSSRTLDLTPITRNAARKKAPPPPAHHDEPMVCSPDYNPYDDDALHGEHLAFPSDLADSYHDDMVLPARGSCVPAIPPLIVNFERATSLGHHYDDVETTIPLFGWPAHQDEDEEWPSAPVPFPSRKLCSFTPRSCAWKDSNDEEDETEEPPLPYHRAQYQPENRDVGSMGEVPPDMLAQIFAASPRREDDVDDGKQHRLAPDEDWSIPSLRQAHAVRVDGSHSVTDTDPDDDDDDDDASWSTRGSLVEEPGRRRISSWSQLQRHNSAPPSSLLLEHSWAGAAQHNAPQHRHHGRRQSKKRKEALAWLASVQDQEQSMVAEAASSRFLRLSSQEHIITHGHDDNASWSGPLL